MLKLCIRLPELSIGSHDSSSGNYAPDDVQQNEQNILYERLQAPLALSRNEGQVSNFTIGNEITGRHTSCKAQAPEKLSIIDDHHSVICEDPGLDL